MVQEGRQMVKKQNLKNQQLDEGQPLKDRQKRKKIIKDTQKTDYQQE